MTHRECFIKALKREKITGLVPHFELVFFLTMEAIGKVHPSHRLYDQWHQMSEKERRLQIKDMAQCYIQIAEKYGHSAIFVHPNPGPVGEMTSDIDSARRILEEIREQTGDEYFLMIHGDPTLPIPNGQNMMEFSMNMYENPEKLHEQSKRNLELNYKLTDNLKNLIDGYAMCSDYCFNTNPFYSREMFSEFISPYLTDSIAYARENGLYTIKHTDGNIMPILDLIVECKPDALHSLDPQGGVNLSEVRRMYGDRVCLIGNVNCGLLQSGTEQEVIDDVRRSLRQGMEGYGYIFSTSNCAYTGLELERYELMNRIWREEGIYK